MEEKGGGRGASPPLFWQGGLAPHFSVENKGIIKKKLINVTAASDLRAAAWLGPPLQITFLLLWVGNI